MGSIAAQNSYFPTLVRKFIEDTSGDTSRSGVEIDSCVSIAVSRRAQCQTGRSGKVY
jgi:hypothetical protein